MLRRRLSSSIANLFGASSESTSSSLLWLEASLARFLADGLSSSESAVETDEGEGSPVMVMAGFRGATVGDDFLAAFGLTEVVEAKSGVAKSAAVLVEAGEAAGAEMAGGIEVAAVVVGVGKKTRLLPSTAEPNSDWAEPVIGWC